MDENAEKTTAGGTGEHKKADADCIRMGTLDLS